jgi:hypothetical protein
MTRRTFFRKRRIVMHAATKDKQQRNTFGRQRGHHRKSGRKAQPESAESSAKA